MTSIVFDRARRELRLAGFVVLCLLAAILATGCAVPASAGALTVQNHANIQAQSANIRRLSDSCRQLARSRAETVVQVARERTAAGLVLVRTSITPDDPTDAELSDPQAAWSKELDQRAARLRARLDVAPLPDRAAAAASLADSNPAEIDIAVGTPGFDSARVLRDAMALDTVNLLIQREPEPAIRSALSVRRNALLDAYMPARLAAASASRTLDALQTLTGVLEEQTRIAELHARALSGLSSSPGADLAGSATSIYRDDHLRAAVLDLVRTSAGEDAAARVQDRLARIDAALIAIP